MNAICYSKFEHWSCKADWTLGLYEIICTFWFTVISKACDEVLFYLPQISYLNSGFYVSCIFLKEFIIICSIHRHVVDRLVVCSTPIPFLEEKKMFHYILVFELLVQYQNFVLDCSMVRVKICVLFPYVLWRESRTVLRLHVFLVSLHRRTKLLNHRVWYPQPTL